MRNLSISSALTPARITKTFHRLAAKMNQRKFDRSLLVASWFLPTAWLLLSTAIASADQAAIGLLLEPAHLEPEVSQKVAGGENTVMVPARKTKFGFNRIDQAAWTADGLDWAQVQIEARQLADAVSEELEIEWVRDERKVILYGLIQSGNPFAPSVIYSEKFRMKVKPILGAEILVIIPSRDQFYIFPKYGNKLAEFSRSLVDRYRESPLKVSLEIIEISREGAKVVGAIGE